MFGIELRSARGNQYISDKTYPLLYWGYVDVSFVSGSISVLDFTYQRLFNLPLDAEITIAVRTISVGATSVGTNGAYLYPVKRTDGWYVAISGDNATFTARVYVFVHAKDIAQPRYGIAVFNKQGQVIFHNRRPPMAYKQMFYSDLDNTFVQSSVPVGYMPATVVWSVKVEPYNVGYYRYFNSAHSLPNGGYGVGMTRSYVRAASYNYQFVSRFYYPVIDAGYFEQFPNLGNYPQ